MRRIFLILLASVAAGEAWSHDHVENPVVRYRHTLMESVAKHMKMSMMVAKGEVARTDDLVAHANFIHHASQSVLALFPPETAPDKVESDAKPEIWKQWDDFTEKAKAFEAESTRLVEVAGGGDLAQVKDQLEKVGATCGSCHERYRVDRD